jgi:dihydroorotate dehydrogenase
LKFKNPVGLAAGFDKDAKLFNELSDLGFGFIEIGTLTPKSQAGNDKKRLFRLKRILQLSTEWASIMVVLTKQSKD